MKILYVKAGLVGESSGGGLEARKIWGGLEELSTRRADCEAVCVSADADSPLIRSLMARSPFRDRMSRALLHSSYVYVNWRFGGLKRAMVALEPDVVVLGNSRLGFMARWFRNHASGVQLICHYDNVERDYVDVAWGASAGIFQRVLRKIEAFSVWRDERDAVGYAHVHLVLTQRDQMRLQDLYGCPAGPTKVLPICLDEPEDLTRAKGSGGLHLLFVGSLWYVSNQEAVFWFLEKVWPSVLKRYPDARFTVAGRRPATDFAMQLSSEPGVRLIADFARLNDVLLEDMVMVAPIRKGAGMKVKVAESLSLGMPVIASEEALIGYDEALKDPLSQGVLFPARSPGEYMDAIDRLVGRNVEADAHQAKRLFRSYYSRGRSDDEIEKLVLSSLSGWPAGGACIETGD